MRPPLRRLAAPLALLVAIAAPAAAQQETRGLQGVLGAQVGYVRADLGGPDGAPFESREGSLVGLHLTLRLNRALSVQPEVLFALKGGRVEVTSAEDGSVLPLDLEFAYIELPVLLRAAAPFRQGRVRPVVFGGPAPAVQIGCDVDLLLTDEALGAPCTSLGPSLRFHDFDFGIIFGGGLEVDWPDAGLALEFRRTVGFRSVVADGADLRNRTWALMLALSF